MDEIAKTRIPEAPKMKLYVWHGNYEILAVVAENIPAARKKAKADRRRDPGFDLDKRPELIKDGILYWGE
jgi:hypothetical protein